MAFDGRNLADGLLTAVFGNFNLYFELAIIEPLALLLRLLGF